MFDRSNSRWRAMAWLACAMLALAGCQQTGYGIADAAAARVNGERVGSANSTLDRGNEDGLDSDPVAGIPLPDTYPKDVYLPTRYTVDSVLDVGGTAMVAMIAPGRVAVLYAEARNTMRAQGWTQTMAAQHSVDNAVVAFEKDRRNATLSFNKAQSGEARSGGGVVVSVQLRE
ncbi:MAG: hypothetical protein ABJA62_06840, partial [Luteimonas sp.]